MRPLRIALTKGRLEKDTVALFDRMGLDTSAVKEKGRRLILPVGDGLEVVLAKAADVLTLRGARGLRSRGGGERHHR